MSNSIENNAVDASAVIEELRKVFDSHGEIFAAEHGASIDPLDGFAPNVDQQERRTREARLLVARPEYVIAELKAYAAEVEAAGYSVANPWLEKSLAERMDPLVDLGLASFASDRDIVSALYRKGLAPASTPLDTRYRKGLRIACLSNRLAYAPYFIGEDETRRVLGEADLDEAAALICNPGVSTTLLQALYERRGPVAHVDEGRWRRLVRLSISNKRIGDNVEGDAKCISDSIFKLLKIAPATREWSSTLVRLLDRIDPQFVARQEDIFDVLRRWDDTIDEDYRWFRNLIGALYGSGDSNIYPIDSPDEAIRCAYYGNATLSIKDMREAYDRDREAFRFAAAYNMNAYHSVDLRMLLEEMQCGENKEFYRKQCERIHNRNAEFDPKPIFKRVTQERVISDTSRYVREIRQWLLMAAFSAGAFLIIYLISK